MILPCESISVSRSQDGEQWPRSLAYRSRFRVEDLVPTVRGLRAVFIGESPHRDEVAPASIEERTPFRGVAGRQWWQEVFQYLPDEGIQKTSVPSRIELLQVCQTLRIALMNAVQYPIDPKITLHQGKQCEPQIQLGFEKAAGPWNFKRRLDSKDVQRAIQDLAHRLSLLQQEPAQLVCLGNDSRWFVDRAIRFLPPSVFLLQKPVVTVPHPSSWWRNSLYRKKAQDVIHTLLST